MVNRGSRLVYWMTAVTAAALICIGLAGSANAVANVFPDQSNLIPASGEFDLLLGQVGHTNQFLNANESWAKFYFDDNTGAKPVAIWDGTCNGPGSGPDSNTCGGHAPDDDRVNYTFYATDANENITGGLGGICTVRSTNDTGTCPSGGPGPLPIIRREAWSDDIMINIPASMPNSTLAKKYVVVMRAWWVGVHPDTNCDSTGQRCGRIHAFKVRNGSGSNPALRTSWANSRNYWIQNRDLLNGSPSDEFRETIEFGAPCGSPADPGATIPATIAWGDADQTSGDANISFKLYEDGIQVPGTPSGSTLGGASDGSGNPDRQFSFTAKRGSHYRWEWDNVNRNNAILIRLPFDGIHYVLGCGDSFNLDVSVSAIYRGRPGVAIGDTRVPVDLDPTGVANVLVTVRSKNNGSPQSRINYTLRAINPDSSPVDQFVPIFTPPHCPPANWPDCTGSVTSHSGGGSETLIRFEFKPDMTTPITDYCFYGRAEGQNGEIQDSDPNLSCFTFVKASYPYLNTDRGDVHAGGNILGLSISTCLADPSTGRIRGRISGSTGSKAKFIVSSASNINNFGSGDSVATVNQKLIVSNDGLGAGFYGSICRPDLEKNIEEHYLKPPLDSNTQPAKGWAPGLGSEPIITSYSTSRPVNSTDQGRLFACSYPGFACGNPSILDLPSDITKRYTIYVKGNVRITQNIEIKNTAPFPPRFELPSFGLVATGNILIDPGVTRLDGFYFAGGFVDTCRGQNIVPTGPSGSPSPAVTACGQNLVVNGMMMADEFKFKRTFTTGGAPAELIRFQPLFYVATPPGFSDFVTNAAIRPFYFGESNPLY